MPSGLLIHIRKTMAFGWLFWLHTLFIFMTAYSTHVTFFNKERLCSWIYKQAIPMLYSQGVVMMMTLVVSSWCQVSFSSFTSGNAALFQVNEVAHSDLTGHRCQMQDLAACFLGTLGCVFTLLSVSGAQFSLIQNLLIEGHFLLALVTPQSSPTNGVCLPLRVEKGGKTSW